MLHPDYWGKGLATEAAEACLNYAKDCLKAKRVIALATPNNRASLRVLNNIGMHYEKNRLYYGEEFQQLAWLNKVPPE